MTPKTNLRIFAQRNLQAAIEWASQGFQALHVIDGSFAYLRKDTPDCFKRRKEIAHLFDQSKTRLIRTACALGVRVVLVEREGTDRQHVDLCGKPLERAKELARQEEWEAQHHLDL